MVSAQKLCFSDILIFPMFIVIFVTIALFAGLALLIGGTE